MQGYKGFRQINQEANRRLKEMGLDKVDRTVHAKHEPVVKPLFSTVREIPRDRIEVRPELFQGRETAYAEETVEKIVREGFDKSREPIVVWEAPDGKYVVISGHSRLEASRRLYEAGNKGLATMPVKIFNGDLHDATDYALLESNREVTQEGLKSDLKAYKRAKDRGYNREHLKGLFKPESRLRLLEDISNLNEHGSFLNYLGTEAEKSLPYLQRNAQWVGMIRKDVPMLTNEHEEEMFRYLYGLSADNKQAGKKKITISKDEFFNLVNHKVSRIDFDPQQALNLDEHVSTSALTDPAKEEIQVIRAEIDGLVKERDKKDELIANATSEGKTELVEKFRQRQSDINKIITRKLLEIQKLEQQIGQIERTAFDLFSEADDRRSLSSSENIVEVINDYPQLQQDYAPQKEDQPVSHSTTQNMEALKKFTSFLSKYDRIDGYMEEEKNSLHDNAYGLAKQNLKKLGKKAFKELADYLGLKKYEINFNPGGPSVSGDLTLMGMFTSDKGIYISMNKDGLQSGVLYRSIKSMKDYSGGGNNYFAESELEQPEEIKAKIFRLLKLDRPVQNLSLTELNQLPNVSVYKMTDEGLRNIADEKKPEEKEPDTPEEILPDWKMSQQQYLEKMAVERGNTANDYLHWDKGKHKQYVAKALKAGEEVPEHVRADYPNLNYEKDEEDSGEETGPKKKQELETTSDTPEAWQMPVLKYQEMMAVKKTGQSLILNARDRQQHRQLVEWALANKKDIPANVLKDYPDLENTGNEKKSEQSDELSAETIQPEKKWEFENTLDAPPAWELSLKNYMEMMYAKRKVKSPVYDAKDRKDHKQAVKFALGKNLDVPDFVLKEYPDLVNPIIPPAQETGNENLLLGDKWFEKYPEKILGTVQHTTNQFNRPVTVVTGTLDEALQAINIPAVNYDTQEQSPLETEIKAPLDDLLNDPVKKLNIDSVIANTLKEHADKTVQKLKGEKDKSADGPSEEYYSFETIMANYNKGISEDEIKAWIWHKRKSGGLNDEITILKKSNGWSKYVVPNMNIQPYRDRWLKNGVMCYYKGDYLPSVIYYAENIYERLKALNAEKDEIVKLFGKEQFERQFKGLENIKPPRLSLTAPKLSQRLFIKPDSAFVEGIFIEGLADGAEESPLPKDERTDLLSAFKTWLNTRPKDEFKKTTNLNIIKYYLERQNPPRYHDEEERMRVKQFAKKEGDALFVRFLAEALLPKDQAYIEDHWNRIYNGYVDINYMKVPVAFTCSSTFKNKPLFIRSAQREGIGFISVNGSGCIAYDVGVGKTMTAILSLAQALELGQCKRPFIVVPNATYSNWIAELSGKTENGKLILTGLLPQYPINDLYNLSEEHLDKVRNEKGMVQAVPERSITLLTYEGFNRLCFTDATWLKLGDELFEILNQGQDSIRDEQKLKGKIEELMGKGSRGGIAYIEDLGFDYMVVDEAHAMKKSFTRVKGEMKDKQRQKSTYELSSGEPSMTALRGFMISQYILRNNGMRNVQLLTATPFTNNPLEIYSILSLIAYQQLLQWGIRNLKDFFDTFIRTSIELTINARLRPERKEIVLGFNNLVAMQQLIFKFITYKTGEDALIQRPNKIVLPLLNHMVNGELEPLPPEQQISTNLPMTNEQKQLMARIEQFVTGRGKMSELCNAAGLEEELLPGVGKGMELRESAMSNEEKEGARVLRALSFARQVALSPYLFACHAGGNPDHRSYVETSPTFRYVMGCIRSVKEYHEQHNEPVSGQIIYMNAGVQYFPLLKDYLVKVIGYDESEVGIISSGISTTKKEGIKERYQAGSIKIIIGSGTIKEGINLQNRTTVLYNCWLDWNPTDVKQLEGRAWRFGNIYANVRVVTPLLEDSITMFIFQKLEEKTSRINEIWYRAGKENALDLEDFNPAELKMGLVTNPKILAELMLVADKEEMQDEVARLNNEKSILTNIDKARKEFNNNIGHIRQRTDRYRPQRAGASPRAPSTLLNIFSQYMRDETQHPTDQDEDTYWKVYRSYNTMERGLEEILKPRGLDLQFDEKKVFTKIDGEVAILKKRIEEEAGEKAITAKEAEIIKERKRKGYQRKTVEERIKEFARMNDEVLNEMMIYDKTEEGQIKLAEQNELGRDLETSADTIDELEGLVRDMEEMEKILQEMQTLEAA